MDPGTARAEQRREEREAASVLAGALAGSRPDRRRDAREIARDLIARGWSIVPVPRGTKIPVKLGWQKGGFTPEDAELDGNLGVLLGKPSGGLADVDKDCREAVAAWRYFGPATDRRHGRAGNPDSHSWYISTDRPDFPIEKIVDPTLKNAAGRKCTLIELRGTGGQTVIHGWHPDGDEYVFEAEGDPAPVTHAELLRAVRKTAAVAMLARRDALGIRHDVGLALVGLLLRGGMPREEVLHFIEVWARVCGHADVEDRLKACRSTADKIDAGKPATGGPTLERLLPDGSVVVGKLRELLGLSGPTSVESIEDVTPLDVFGDATLAGAPELPPDALPVVIAEFADDTATRMGSDVAGVALPGIVVSAAAIDDRYVIQPRRHDTDWTESPRVWLGIVAEPGQLKTPSIDSALRALREAQARWADEDHRAAARYEIDRKVYEHRLKKYVSSDNGQNLPPIEPPKPPRRRLLMQDLTTEGMRDVLCDNIRGVLVHADELSGWLGSFDCYRPQGGKDRALWLEAYNGGPRLVDRAGKALRVPNWSACVVGGIQPGPARRLIAKISDDGLVARTMLAFLRPATEGEDRAPNHGAIRRYREMIFRLVDLPAPNERIVFTLSEDAQVERETVSVTARNVMLLPDTSAAFRGHLSKWDGLFARLLLTYHMIDAAAADAEPEPIISGNTARKVARLMVDYLLPNAARFYVEVMGHDHANHARWVAGYILAHGCERISARDVGRGNRELRGDRVALATAMESLNLAGWVSPTDANGRQPTRWSVNPRVHAQFAERAMKERERRLAVREQVARAAAALGLSEVAE